jgi:hypothetical protein
MVEICEPRPCWRLAGLKNNGERLWVTVMGILVVALLVLVAAAVVLPVLPVLPVLLVISHHPVQAPWQQTRSDERATCASPAGLLEALLHLQRAAGNSPKSTRSLRRRILLFIGSRAWDGAAGMAHGVQLSWRCWQPQGLASRRVAGDRALTRATIDTWGRCRPYRQTASSQHVQDLVGRGATRCAIDTATTTAVASSNVQAGN